MKSLALEFVFNVTLLFCLQTSTTPRHMPQKHSLLPISELEKRLDSPESLSCGSPEDSYVSFKIFEGINEAKQL